VKISSETSVGIVGGYTSLLPQLLLLLPAAKAAF